MDIKEIFKKYEETERIQGDCELTYVPQYNYEDLVNEIIKVSRVGLPVKPACGKCKWIETQLKKVIAYPTKAQGRRTKDGYPQEFLYDEFAYKRLVDSFRQALKDILKDSKSV